MKIRLLILTFIVLSFIQAKAQNFTVALKSDTSFASIKNIYVYAINKQADCDQEKTIDIIEQGKVSSCFYYLRALKLDAVHHVIKILRSKQSYYKDNFDCFATDYAFLLVNDKNKAVAYINISSTCRKIYSNVFIPEVKALSPKNLILVSFTKQAFANLMHTLKIDNYRPYHN